jgi:diguanylate cyclase
MATVDNDKTHRGFATRIYPGRAIGLILTFISFYPAMQSTDQPLWVWCGFATYCFLWPHIAFFYSSFFKDDLPAGKRQLIFDAFICGFWVAAIDFNLIPGAVILTMVALNNISTGGLVFVAVGFLIECLGLAVGVAVFGWNPHFESSLYDSLASLPTLVLYPLTIGFMNYQFAIRIYEQKKQLHQLSRIDGLTGLYNRRYWQSRALEEFERCNRNSQKSVLIMIDIDHFKAVNDTFGHNTGDDVIRGLGDILQHQLRNIDITGRFGGEEFAVILTGTDLQVGKKIAERLRAAVANQIIGENTSVKCTISLGVAEIDGKMRSLEDWISAADSALYSAKERGRNCYCIYATDKQ